VLSKARDLTPDTQDSALSFVVLYLSTQMMGKSFRGDLSEVGLPDILDYLRSSHKTGLLTFRQDRIKKTLFVKEGNVIFGSSNLQADRLGDLLLASGTITKEQYHQSVALISFRKRQGKILVEIGAITPKQLWSGVQDQVRQIVYSLFNWDTGLFFFSEGELPSQENITADIEITELIVEGIRRIRHLNAIKHKFPSMDVILSHVNSSQEKIKMEPFEKHVFGLVNAKRSIQDICRESEIGDSETMKVLYMLVSIGYTRVKGRKMEEGQERKEISVEETVGIIGNYNRMFSYLYRYMLREVGPITEHVLNKYLSELKETTISIFKNVALKKDGTLDSATLQGNLNWIRAESRRDVLVSSLNEFLYSSILAVKRTLGPEHESRVIESLKDVRPEL
jgi:hypothetical protein